MDNLNYRERVGLPIGQLTKVGRPIYETDKGEYVSELSRTIPLNSGKVVNVPAIHGR